MIRHIRLTGAAAVAAALFLASGCGKRTAEVRLMYWNIQNGMWAGQENGYLQFTSWVDSYSPDICIWCEAQSIYHDGTAEKLPAQERYLTGGWEEIAARYGHKYVFTGGHRDNYPQVITSRYPINAMDRIVGAEPDSVVTHGAGWAQIDINGHRLNIVCLHTWPQKFAFRAMDIRTSAEENGGDLYRRKEIEYICRHTILSCPEEACWIMAGDFNSVSRTDNSIYGYPTDDSRFIVQDYISKETPYIDIIKEIYPDEVKISTVDGNRIDYVFCSPTLYRNVTWADIIRDQYTMPVRDTSGKTSFCRPSDHLPAIVDFNFL